MTKTKQIIAKNIAKHSNTWMRLSVGSCVYVLYFCTLSYKPSTRKMHTEANFDRLLACFFEQILIR